ncbi:MipA/OmpV family protein [Aliikangiella coralliicola]|uniref:MipA/OmpV family protein n=1 Tax=Aliikangiella coralliicola TaxID=2592383 RepID=A0A545UBQ8_9GAMM|nr:MipA/OmpV family protein [Aliikangiella coralliicola]TQV86898.1 MipA/OmpV family protein [Aliikangiella coralliicola]
MLISFKSISSIFLLLMFLSASGRLLAEEPCQKESDDCTAVDTWAFGVATGLGIRTNPLVDGDDIPLVILPSISYYGDNFFINNLDFGYTFHQSEEWMFSLLATPSYDRVFFERWDVGNILVNLSATDVGLTAGGDTGDPRDNLTEITGYELKDRKFSILGGLEISKLLEQGEIQFNILSDLSDIHSGNEVRFAWTRPIFNRQWQSTIGFTWKDKAMTDYYYGVDADEIVDNRAAYQAKDSFSPFIRIAWKQQSTDGDFWRFGLEYQKLDSSISDSPIVDKDYVITLFFGKQFNF